MKRSTTANGNTALKSNCKHSQSFQNSNNISENLELSIHAYLLSSENRMIPFTFTVQNDALTDHDASHKNNSCVKRRKGTHKDASTNQKHNDLHGNMSLDHAKEPPELLSTTNQQKMQHYNDVDVFRIVCTFTEVEDLTDMCELNTEENCNAPVNKKIPIEISCVKPVDNENTGNAFHKETRLCYLNGVERLEHSKSITHKDKDITDMLYGTAAQKYKLTSGNSCDHTMPLYQEKEDVKKTIKKKQMSKKHLNDKLLKKASPGENNAESESSMDQFPGKFLAFTDIEKNPMNTKQRNRNRIFKDQIKSAVESYLDERLKYCDVQQYIDFSEGKVLSSSESSSLITENCLSYSDEFKHFDSSNASHLKDYEFPVEFENANMKLKKEKHKSRNKTSKHMKKGDHLTNILPETSTNDYEIMEVVKNNQNSKNEKVYKDCSVNTSPSLLLELNAENSTNKDELIEVAKNNSCNSKKEKVYKDCSTNTSPKLLREIKESELSDQSTRKNPEKINQPYSEFVSKNLTEKVVDKLSDMDIECNMSLKSTQNTEDAVKFVCSNCDGIENEVQDICFTSVTSIRNTPEAVFSHISQKTEIERLDKDETFRETTLTKTMTGSENPTYSVKHEYKKEPTPLVDYVDCRETYKNESKEKLGKFNSGDQMAYALYGTSFSPKRTSEVNKEEKNFGIADIKEINKLSKKEPPIKHFVDNKIDTKKILNEFNLGNNMTDMIYGGFDLSNIQETNKVSNNISKSSSSAQNSQTASNIHSNNFKLNNVKIEDIIEMNKFSKAEPSIKHHVDNTTDTRKILTEFNMGNNMTEMIYGQYDSPNIQETSKVNQQTKIITQSPEHYLILPGVISLIKCDSQKQTAQKDEYSSSNEVNPLLFNSKNDLYRLSPLAEEHFGLNALGYGSKINNVITLEEFLNDQARNNLPGHSLMQQERLSLPFTNPYIGSSPIMAYKSFGNSAINQSMPKHGYGNTYLTIDNNYKVLRRNSENTPKNTDYISEYKEPTSSFGNTLLDINNGHWLLKDNDQQLDYLRTNENPAIKCSKLNAAKSFQSKGMADSMGGAPLNVYHQDMKPLDTNEIVQSRKLEYRKTDNSINEKNNFDTKCNGRNNESQNARCNRKPRGIVPGLD